jgi:Alpha/beta hydrolase domain
MNTAVPGKPNLLLGSYDLATLGYGAEEFFVSGNAASYAAVGEFGHDGRWSVRPAERADYTTRIVVLRPTDDAAFNGSAIVEWLNVSGGIDAPAVWFMAHREIVRAGYAYVAVSTQGVGVEGGASLLSADMSLKAQNPERYSSLKHPGDAFAYDIYSQVGRLVKEGNGLFGDLQPKIVLAVGESQSAMFLTTYVNAVDPLAEVYDGFLVHSRFGPAAPLDGTAALVSSSGAPSAAQFRADVRVPLITLITETDLLDRLVAGYHRARQPDNERFRAWEIPGTAHADNYTIQVSRIDTGSAAVDEIVAAYEPTDILMGQQLSHAINFAPQHHYVLEAAIANLNGWVRTAVPAPTAPPISLTEADPPAFVVDANGLARGGVHTPWVDVPLARTSGVADGESAIAALFGSGERFDAATLQRLYSGGRAEYLERFAEALDRTIEAGFIVAADRGEILELAAATFPSPVG